MAVNVLALLFNQRCQQLVTFALMIAFPMIVSREFGQGSLQWIFAQEN